MNRYSLVTISAATALGLALLAGNAVAQQKTLKDQLAGTWSLASITTTRPDGTKSDSFEGSIAYFGTYMVDEADKSYTTRVEGSTFPNWTGLAQKRMVVISGNDLTITNPAGSGGGTAVSKWTRVPAPATN